MKVDPRFLKEEGTEVFLGNELLVKGLLETEGGTHLWTGYPGSPVSGFFDCVEAIQEIPKQYGISAVLANNEALSAAMVNGSQMHGLRAMCVMKSVGLHVATDALALGNLAGAHPEGGVVVVMGDDPWSDSTQVPADSRYLCKHIFMPVLEPTTNQEMKDWVDLAFRLSRESELYIGYLVTTNQADGGGSVQVARNHFPRVNTHNPIELDTARVDFEKNVLLPPRTWRREQEFPRRYERLWASARRHGVNRLSPGRAGVAGGSNGRTPLGFISSALAHSYLEHALQQLGLTDTFPILKLGITYPLDPELIDSFANQVETVVVVEERRGFLEEQVVQLLARRALTGKPAPPVYGKIFPGGREGLPTARGFNSSILVELLAPLITELAAPRLKLDHARIERELALLAENRAIDVQLAPRTPTFCPGCPHRDSAGVLGEIKRVFRDADYMRRTHRREPVDLVFHGDTGCYTMLMFEPNKDLMHNYSGMGLGGATGLGIDPFITNKQVVFMGDSTFFHSGQIAISNSIKNGQDITYIILDNKTTAMTGQQTTPGLDYDLLGNETFVQKIERIIEAMIADHQVEILRVNPARRDAYRTLLESTVLKNGVKVVVADKECGITFHRRRNREERAEVRQKGFVESKRHIQIVSDACEHCLECTRATGCPGLTFLETDFGRKVQTDLSWCVNDTACTKLDACPAFEEVTVIRSQKPLTSLPDLEKMGEIPLPVRRDFDPVWHGYLAGVGGMGIGVATATLVRAGHREGYQVVFSDKNGLAIRNGGVFSHITFLKPGHRQVSPIIPYGKADLMLGIDILEAARGLDPKGHLRVGGPATRAIVNRQKTPTINTLLGTDDFCVETLEAALRRHTDAAGYFSADVSRLSEGAFGTKLYANVIMLGIAFQRGELPLSLDSLEYGIQETMGSAATENWLAFKLGRKIAHDALARPLPAAAEGSSYHDLVAEKSARLRRSGRGGERLARQYWQLVTGAREKLTLDARHESLLAQRVYDLIRYENLGYAADYVARLLRVQARDSARFQYAATQAALWNLHRVMTIKDEVYVAWLLSSEEKYERDLERYNVRPELGDRLVHRHLNRPEFTCGRRTLRFRIRTRPWMLRLMRRAKFLRRLLPAWHARERAFRDWYFQVADQFEAPSDPAAYAAWLKILRLPEETTGYREIRYPKMERAQKQAAEILASLSPPAAASQSLS